MRPDETFDGARPSHPALDLLRTLAADGQLQSAEPNRLAELRGAAYHLVWPLVWYRHTRRIELGRGHPACAASLAGMAASCLDRFHDDLEAVVDYVFVNLRRPVHNLEGWVTSRIKVAVVDGYRKRRGRVGALQRIRVPGWLGTALDDDPELVELAGAIIEWVGVPATAGIEQWPLRAWAERRAALTGTQQVPRVDRISEDVQRVLATMRRIRPTWFESYIERPMGHKQAPTVAATPTVEREAPTTAQSRAERAETEMVALAAAATDAISDALAAGEDPAVAVPRVLRAVFVSTTDAVPAIDVAPGGEPADGADRLTAILADEATVQRLVADVLRVIGRTSGQPVRKRRI